MIIFRPLIRYADFRSRARRTEYWGFAILQGLFYTLLIGLAAASMGQSDTGQATAGVVTSFGLLVISVLGLVVPNYAVLVRRLHDSGRGAIWLVLIVPNILSSVITAGTIATAVGSVGLGASREAFVATALTGLGTAGILGLIGMVGQLILFVLTLLPGTAGENRFGPDPRDPSRRYRDEDVGSPYDDARLDALFAEAKRANGLAEGSAAMHGTSVDSGRPALSNGITLAPTFGRRGA